MKENSILARGIMFGRAEVNLFRLFLSLSLETIFRIHILDGMGNNPNLKIG